MLFFFLTVHNLILRKLLLISFKKDWIEPNALFLNLRRQEYLDVSLPSLFFSVALSVIGYKHPAKQGQIIYRLTLKILYGKLWIAFKYLPQVSEKKKFPSGGTYNAEGYGDGTSLQWHQVTGLSYGHTYYVRVRGYNLDGSNAVYGEWSSVKTVTVQEDNNQG